MNISTYNKTKIGFSHIKKNIVCQDYSLSYSSPDNSLFISIVSDGHGGKTYCRSDKGSRFACEIALDAIKGLSGLSELLKGKSAQVSVRKKIAKSNQDDTIENFESILPQIKDIDPIFEHLFQYIYTKWVQQVELDWKENPPTKEEKSLLGGKEIVKAYGATLMAFVKSTDYWFGFQIGDGKCLACDENKGWYEPILWDSECFLNLTTSLCGSDAYKSFRYSFSGKGDFPIAVMLGTDGIDDSWGDKLTEYYTSILEDIANLGVEKAKISLADSLPDLSKNGSGDDVSIAWVIDTDKISTVLPKLIFSDNKTENEKLNIRIKQLEDYLKRIKEEQKEDKEKYLSDLKSLNVENEKYNEKVKSSDSEIQTLQLELEKIKNKSKNETIEKDELLKDNKDLISSLQSEKMNLSKLLSEAIEKKQELEEQKNDDEVEETNSKPNSDTKKKTIKKITNSKIFILLIGICLGVISTFSIHYFVCKNSQKKEKIETQNSEIMEKDNKPKEKDTVKSSVIDTIQIFNNEKKVN